MTLTSDQRRRINELRMSFMESAREMGEELLQQLDEGGKNREGQVRWIAHWMDTGYKKVVSETLRIINAP